MAQRSRGRDRENQICDMCGRPLRSKRNRQERCGPWSGADICGRPLMSKRNLQERCGTWSGADMCAAFDAAYTPQARMGVRGSGPIEDHAIEALVVKLVFLIPFLDRCAISP